MASHQFREKIVKHRIGRFLLFVGLFLIGAGAACSSQEVPKGVRYTKASAEVNAKAKSALEQALSGDVPPTGFLNGHLMCGPVLWNDLVENHQALSKDSIHVGFKFAGPDLIVADGREFTTKEQRNLLWKLVFEKYPQLKKGTVRIATASEIQFFWDLIPFDIQEPFFAIDSPDGIFIAHLNFEKKTNSIWLNWFDRVDDLKNLKK